MQANNFFKFYVFSLLLAIPFKNMAYQLLSLVPALFFLFNQNFRSDLSRIDFSPIKTPFILFVASLLVSIFLGSEVEDGLVIVLKWIIRFALLFLFIVVILRLKFLSEDNLLKYVFSTLYIISLLGLVQYFFGFDIITYRQPYIGMYITGPIYSNAVFGSLMSLIISIGLVFIFYSEKKNKRMLLISLSLPLYMLLASGSRAAYFMFLAFLLLYFIKFINKKVLLKYIVPLFLAIPLLILFLVNLDFVHPLMVTDSRTGVWYAYLVEITQKPIIGYGYNRVLEYLPHNIFLEILAMQGVLGLAVFIYICIKFVRHVNPNFSDNKTLGIGSILFSIFCFLLLDGSFYQSKIVMSYLSIFAAFLYYRSFIK